MCVAAVGLKAAHPWLPYLDKLLGFCRRSISWADSQPTILAHAPTTFQCCHSKAHDLHPSNNRPSSVAAEGIASEPSVSLPRLRRVQAYTSPTPPAVVGDLDELNRLVNQASTALRVSSDWVTFFKSQRDAQGDLGDVSTMNHPARHLLTHYKKQGVPVTMQTRNWSKGQRLAALGRDPRKHQ